MSSSYTYLHVGFKGYLNDIDEDDDEIDIGEIDARASGMDDQLNRLQPHRNPHLRAEHLGNSGDVELIYRFRITWMDRDGDINDYLDEVQSEIENGLNMLVHERENLGTTTE